MTTRVLDTSVAIAWYLPERYSIEARLWRTALAEGRARLVVPGFHFWEMANVLRTYVKRGEISAVVAREIYTVHCESGLETAEPDQRSVVDVALEYDATAYDAVYIALSLQRQIPLLTSERTTTPWVVKLGKLAEPIGRK